MRRLRLLVLLAFLLVGSLPAGSASAIVGGRDAEIASWPFLVALTSVPGHDDFQRQFCGGSVIAPRVVLTAAHCLDGRPMTVVAGKTTLSASGGERVAVVERRMPPSYDAANNEPDLAVLVLAHALSAPPIAVAAPLDSALVAPGTPLGSAGWGVAALRPDPSYADHLQAAVLTALPGASCRAAYGDVWIARTMMCAGARGGRPDTCQGDSGGPLVGRDPDGVARLVGVVSFGGPTCGSSAWPGVYARTAPAATWIAREVARATMAPAPPLPRAPLSPAERRSIRLRFGAVGCKSTSRCFVDVRTTGPVERLGGGLVVHVRRGGRNQVDRVVIARRIRQGHWRAWTNLPWGDVRLSAYGIDERHAVVTRVTRVDLAVTAG